MSTIKQDRKDLEMLLNGVDPISAPSAVPRPQQTVDNTSDTALPVEHIFDYDYEGSRKRLRKKARKTIDEIVRHILPDDLLADDYVSNKIDQDTDTLTELYMQVESNAVMQRSILETVSRGNTMPRLYEVFGQLTDKVQALNKQIVDTEQKIRKTYMDIKYEIRDKQSEDGRTAGALGAPQGMQQGGGLIVSSSKDLIAMARKGHLDAIRDVKEAQYTEEQ